MFDQCSDCPLVGLSSCNLRYDGFGYECDRFNSYCDEEENEE